MEVLNDKLRMANIRFIVATVLLAAPIFVADVMLPMGTGVWLLYVIVLLLSLWSPHRHYALVVAAASTVLIVLGFFFCPPGISPRLSLFNRSLGVLVIWVTAVLCLLYRRREEELGKSQARLASLVGSAMDAIITINGSERIILFNASAEKMFLCSADEAIGQAIDRFIPERFRSTHREHIRAFGETSVTKRSMGALGAIYGLRADGEEFPIEASISQVEEDGQKLYTVILRDIIERRQAEDQLRSSHEQLRALAAHLQSVREEERTRIARNIHDELGQGLTGLRMDLAWLAGRIREEQKPLLEKTKLMTTLVDTMIQEVREIATELRPGVLDDLGLAAAIEWEAREFQSRAGIRCQVTLPVEEIPIDPARSTTLFRIFQEILTNVARHAGATSVNAGLKEDAGNLILEVRDNGRGITEGEISDPKSVGLLGMRERALVFGGEIKITGTPGKGTTVTVRIPLQRT